MAAAAPGYGFAPGASRPDPRDRPWQRYDLRDGDFGAFTILPLHLLAALRAWTEHEERRDRRHAKARKPAGPAFPSHPTTRRPDFGAYRVRHGSRHAALAAYARRSPAPATTLHRSPAASRKPNLSLPDPLPPPRARAELRSAAVSAVSRFGRSTAP